MTLAKEILQLIDDKFWLLLATGYLCYCAIVGIIRAYKE